MTSGEHMKHPAANSDYCAFCLEQWPCADSLKEAAAALGRKGGKAGKGAAKRRGDSAYYKALRAKATKPKH